MTRIDLSAVTRWITVAADQHPSELCAAIEQRLGVSRRRARRVLDQLVALQWLHRGGTRRRPLFRPGTLRQVVQRYELPDVQEDLAWSRDFAPYLELPEAVARLARHALTELVNNAAEHSGGTQVTVSVRQTPTNVQLLVSDDGCGLFERIGSHHRIATPALAMLELGKGKLTSQPARHTGRGLYFTARVADVLDLHANETAFQHRAWQPHQWQPVRPAARRGTSVFAAFALDSQRSIDAALREHSLEDSGYAFERTRVALQLLGAAEQVLESRAQARRVSARLAEFRRAEIDFEGIAEVGHSFADELFRVFAAEQPALELVPLGMSPRVAEMLASVRAAA